MDFLQQVLNQASPPPDYALLAGHLIRALESNAVDSFLLVSHTGTVLMLSQAARQLLQTSLHSPFALNMNTMLTDRCVWHRAAQSSTRSKGASYDYEWDDTLQVLDDLQIKVHVRASWLSHDLYLIQLTQPIDSGSPMTDTETWPGLRGGLEQRLAVYQKENAELRITERLYRNAFNQTFQLSCLLTPDGTILDDNQTALDFCRLQRAGVIGKAFADLHCWQISPEVKDRIEHSIAQAAQGSTVRFETDILSPDNDIVTIDFSVKPSLNEAGKVEFLIAEGRDLTERKRVELALKTSEARFRTILETMPLIGIVLDQQAKITFVNNFFLELTGWPREEILQRNWFDWFVPESKRDEIYSQTFQTPLRNAPTSTHYEYAILTRWGEQRLVSWRCTVLTSPFSDLIELACIGEDITERRRGERNLQQQTIQEQLLADINHQVRQSLDLNVILKTAVNQIQQALNAEQVLVFQLNAEGEGHTVAASESVHRTGWPLRSICPLPVQSRPLVQFQRLPQMVDAPILRQLDDGSVEVWGLLIVHTNGMANDFIEVEWFLRQLADQLAIAIYQSELYQQAQTELASRQQAVDQFRHDALHDSLTGLPNYPCLLQQLNKRLGSEASTNSGYPFAVLFLDLNRFKAVNDTFGHEVGDQLLRVVAQRLRTCIRETDLVARRSGDEFLFLLHPINRPKEAIDVAQRVKYALSQPISVDYQRLTVSGSIGIVLGNQYDTDAERLLQDADRAMYEAKRRNQTYFLWPVSASPPD
jgi:diguanylate cyclase (GGDEF)-like protein/PAS domain S-box-containing protein